MRIDLSKVSGEVFYKYIYPMYPREFLYGSYEAYATMVQSLFILNSTQWEYILEEWESKQYLLTSRAR